MTTKMLESYFTRTTFRLFIIGNVWQLFSNFGIKIPKRVFWNILPIIEKIKNGPLIFKKSKIRARQTNSLLLKVQKDICVQEILLLEVCAMGWGV